MRAPRGRFEPEAVANYKLALRRVLLPWMGRQNIAGVEKLTSRDLVGLSNELLDEGGSRGQLSRSSAWIYCWTPFSVSGS